MVVVVTVAVARLVLVEVRVRPIQKALACPSTGSSIPLSMTSIMSWIILVVAGSISVEGRLVAQPDRRNKLRRERCILHVIIGD